jgi:hypothetical protein
VANVTAILEDNSNRVILLFQDLTPWSVGVTWIMGGLKSVAHILGIIVQNYTMKTYNIRIISKYVKVIQIIYIK